MVFSIIDTKHLAGHSLISPLLEATALEVVAESVQKEPFSSVGPKVFMASGFDRYKTSELVETQESSDTRKAIDVKDRSAPTTPGATAPKEKVPDAQFHEAGYDAYMTGLSFLRFAGYILKQHERRMAEGEGEGEEEHVRKRQRLEDSADVTGNEVALESTETSNGDYKKPETSVGREDAEVEEGELDETPMERDALIERRKRVIMNNPTKEILEWNGLTSYYNLLHMMRSDIPVMNLKGPEEVPEDRPWSFLLKNIPSGFQTSTLFYLFAPYKPVRFNWVDDSTAWIHIPRQDVSMTVLDSTTPKNITEKTPSDIETVTADPELTALSPGLLGAKRVSPMCIGGEELAMKGREAGVVPEAANIEVVAWKTWYDDREVQERQARETQRQQQQRDAVQRPIKRIGRAFALGASTGQGLSAVSSPSADQDQEQQQQPLQQPEAGSGLAATVGNNSPLAVAGTKRKLEDSSSEHDIEGRHTYIPYTRMAPRVQEPLLSFMSDQSLALILPVAVYWTYSMFFHWISTKEFPWLEKYRIHDKEEETRNKVELPDVIRAVIVQQLLQTALGFLVVLADDSEMIFDDEMELAKYERWFETTLSLVGLRALSLVTPARIAMMAHVVYFYLEPLARLSVAMFILDTWQYFLHRLFHNVPTLYKHFHSRHHRLYVNYAFGALYNHPFEGFLMDSVGASVAFVISGMGNRGALAFFSFSTLKTVDDHCGYNIPFNPLQQMFSNNADYHDIHHQTFGIKSNFSQPFGTWWDHVLGTHMSREEASAIIKRREERKTARQVASLAQLNIAKGTEIQEDLEISGQESKKYGSVRVISSIVTKKNALVLDEDSDTSEDSLSVSGNNSGNDESALEQTQQHQQTRQKQTEFMPGRSDIGSTAIGIIGSMPEAGGLYQRLSARGRVDNGVVSGKGQGKAL
ncbi:hypothetical protein BGW38_005960 [Lunasporangiospora selenospora]|uniref:Fatty acid hydroxylase domain-containing protein n=1 Tax=Lunasporangiospora selenospora TaxID=979761 RepID=A0A9P6KIL9_9FUNG|nr:hypothetical protein BGW38_005960 [Lunasporangiospora selenospora]